MLLRWQMPAVLAFAPDAVMLADAGAPAVLALVLAAIMFALHAALLRCAHPPPLSLLLEARKLVRREGESDRLTGRNIKNI